MNLRLFNKYEVKDFFSRTPQKLLRDSMSHREICFIPTNCQKLPFWTAAEIDEIEVETFLHFLHQSVDQCTCKSRISLNRIRDLFPYNFDVSKYLKC